jgi:hypothetical protein
MANFLSMNRDESFGGHHHLDRLEKYNCSCSSIGISHAILTRLSFLDPLIAQRLLAVTLLGAPFACCLLAIPPRETCPLAAPAALLAFSAFFLLSFADFLSLPSLIAACRAASRASGLCPRLSLMTSRDAPTMARCDLTVLLVRFFATSCKEHNS